MIKCFIWVVSIHTPLLDARNVYELFVKLSAMLPCNFAAEMAKVGLVVYAGDDVFEIRVNVWGVPDWYLLGAL